MATLKYQENVKIAFVTLFLALMLFIDPILAAKKSNKSSKSSGGSTKSRQVSTPARRDSASRARQPSTTRTSTSRSSSRISATPRSTSLRSTSSGRTTRYNIRLPSRGVTSRQSGRVTVSRPVTIRPGTTSGTRKPSSGTTLRSTSVRSTSSLSS